MPAGVSAYTALANVTLGSSAANVTFSSISGSYRDLVLIITASVSSGSASNFIRFNSDSGSNYNGVFMQGDGSNTNSSSYNSTIINASTTTSELSTAQANLIINIMDYTATDKHKTVLLRSNNAGVVTIATAARWANTAAITSILVSPTGGNTYAAGSTFALYGVSA
jgi:hypothetical protein